MGTSSHDKDTDDSTGMGEEVPAEETSKGKKGPEGMKKVEKSSSSKLKETPEHKQQTDADADADARPEEADIVQDIDGATEPSRAPGYLAPLGRRSEGGGGVEDGDTVATNDRTS